MLISTENLNLSPLTASDTQSLHTLWTSPEVRRFLWDDRTLALEETKDLVSLSQRYGEESGTGLWGIRVSGSEDLIGFSGLWPFGIDPRPELLFGLHPQYWGQGKAREAADALIRYAFQTLDWSYLPASADRGNTSSHQLLQRLGFDILSGTGTDPVRYQLDRCAIE